MNLFLKGFIIGIAKIIPGVSGAMIAVSFGIYDKLINSITNFFDNRKENFKFLFILGSGIFLSIVFFSNVVSYFLDNYYLITMMFFIGLIMGGMFNFSKNMNYSLKNIIIIISIILLVIFISIINLDNSYVVKNSFMDYIMFFLGGIVEIFTSIVPGISGTAIMMIIGIYDNILMLFSNVFNISFVIDNIMLYISYGLGMMISFIVFSILISYLLKKYRSLFDTVILGLSISSIILLIMMAFKNDFNFIQMVVGIILFFVGILISYLFDK